MRPVVRTVSSRAPAFRLPPGSSRFCCAQGIEDVVDGEVVGAQAVGIHIHVDFAARAADDGDLADAAGVFQLLLDLLVGDQRDVAQGALGGDGDLQDGRGVGIELLHHRLLGGLRQVAARSG